MLADVVPSARLRVYQPLDAFQAEEQAHWERFLLAGAPRPLHRIYRDRPSRDGTGFLELAGGEGADVRVVDGTTYVSPWRTRVRVLESLLAIRGSGSVPFEGAEGLVTDQRIRRTGRELSRLRRRHPEAIPFVQESPWHVPVRWFLLFEDDERGLRERGGRFRLTYMTTVRRAKRRAERAIPTLQRTELSSVAELIAGLHRWLTNFEGRSLLELDYAGLCDLMTWDELDDDHSARELQEAMGALSSEEFPRSADLYQAVLSRSAELRNHESMN
jgi:hypothetical protein